MFLVTSVQNCPQPIHSTSTTQNLPLGTIVQAADGIQGVGEFIYLQGVASTVVGSLVTYDHTFATTLDPATANAAGAKAFAMSAVWPASLAGIRSAALHWPSTTQLQQLVTPSRKRQAKSAVRQSRARRFSVPRSQQPTAQPSRRPARRVTARRSCSCRTWMAYS
jgi:hypothetical protein